MSGLVLNLIGDLKSDRPTGIVPYKAPTPRDQIMYGGKDRITMGQHLNEFDSFSDSKGRSFDNTVLDELFSEIVSCPKS
jgi:hypothetical protein